MNECEAAASASGQGVFNELVDSLASPHAWTVAQLKRALDRNPLTWPATHAVYLIFDEVNDDSESSNAQLS